MSAYHRIITVLVISLLAVANASAQIDMDRQLRERKEQKDNYDDSDRDRIGTFHSFYLTPHTGDLMPAPVDTMMLNFQHRAFIEGLSVAEAYLGTNAGPYQSKIYFDRPTNRWGQFYYALPYGHLFRRGPRMQWYDTKTPYTFLKYLTAGNNEQKEQNFTFTFSSNLGKEWSLGGDIDIDYANGFYANTASKNFTYRVFSYYRGKRYQAFASVGNTNATNQESGGVTDMQYITHPENFEDGKRTLLPKDIPTRYKSTWNRMNYGSGRLHHKYNFGYYKGEEVPKSPSAHVDDASLDELVDEALTGPVVNDSIDLALDPIPQLMPKDSIPQLIPEDSIPQLLPEMTTDSIISTPEQAEAPETTEAPKVRKRLGKSVGQAEVPNDKEGEEAERPEDNRIFVPVANIFHDFALEQGTREFVSLDPQFGREYPDPPIPRPAGGRYFPNDSFYALNISNTLGIEMLEGFRKWVKMGISAFVVYDFRKYSQPLMNSEDATRLEIDEVEKNEATEHSVYAGGRISSNSFKYFDYYALGKVGVAGAQAGEILVKGQLNTRIPLFNDTVSIGAKVDFQNIKPSYYLRKFKASLHEWDRDLHMIQVLRVGGSMDIPFTNTRIYVDFETLQNPITPDMKGIPTQFEGNTRVLAVGIDQALRWKIINWENSVIWQNSSRKDIMPLPEVSVYSNLYLRLLIAKVMTLQIGVDAKWHTGYYAPYYEPSTQAFRPQGDIVIGGKAPLLNVYANAHIKRTRFFLKYYNIGALIFRPDHFTMPNYPLYPPVLRLGVAVDLRN